MEVTGERYLPDMRGQISYEHRHRYLVARTMATGKRVLDIASGEGYGADLLAEVADSVIGIDIDPAATEHSRKTYRNPRLNFTTGSCAHIPLPDNSVEVVTSFETIEHHSDHIEMVGELRRVMTEDGLLVISSPNKLVYSDIPQYSNPFHVKELYLCEFFDLLRSQFANVVLFGQRIAGFSVMHDLSSNDDEQIDWVTSSLDESLKGATIQLPDPMYFIAFCSNAVLPKLHASLFADLDDDLIERMRLDSATAKEDALLRGRSEERAVNTGLTEELASASIKISKLSETAFEANKRIVALEERLKAAEADLDGARAALTNVTSSTAWKLASPLRMLFPVKDTAFRGQ